MNNKERVESSAFTSKYTGRSNRLVNRVKIISDDKEIEVDALWDTGATHTHISKQVASDLGLIPTGIRKIHTPTGTGDSNTYLVSVMLPNNVKIEGVSVGDSEIGEQGLGMLIGMDIIGMGDFAVSSFNGNTTFSFRYPSLHTIDFASEMRIKSAIGKKKAYNPPRKH